MMRAKLTIGDKILFNKLCKVVTVMRYAQHDVNLEDSEQNEVDGMKKGADSTGKVMHM